MKIIVYTEVAGRVEMLMKGDSSMLVNRKPFFLPDGLGEITYREGVVLRVSRLGKNIAPKFADRYWDAYAEGLDMRAEDELNSAIHDGRSWTQATGFDYSTVIGTFVDKSSLDENELVIAIGDAIHQASRTMTIRQGDLIFIEKKTERRVAVRDEVISKQSDGQEIIYCKIK